jgi:hypothetical protein
MFESSTERQNEKALITVVAGAVPIDFIARTRKLSMMLLQNNMATIRSARTMYNTA